LITFARAIDVSEIAALRARMRPKPAWAVIFMKAYAAVAARTPELRQAVMGFPAARLVESPHNIGMLVVPRVVNNERCILLGRFRSPESMPLPALQSRHDYFHTAPVGEIRQFRHQLRFAALPGFLRRFLFWSACEAVGPWRARTIGTFGITISRLRKSTLSNIIAPWTVAIGVDLDANRGAATTVLTFDHRVFDGLLAVETMSALVRELRGPITREMRNLASRGG